MLWEYARAQLKVAESSSVCAMKMDGRWREMRSGWGEKQYDGKMMDRKKSGVGREESVVYK